VEQVLILSVIAALGMLLTQAHADTTITLYSMLQVIAANVEVDSALTLQLLILSEIAAHGTLRTQDTAVHSTMKASLLQTIAALARLLHFNFNPPICQHSTTSAPMLLIALVTLAHGTQSIQRAAVHSTMKASPLLMTARNVEPPELALVSKIVSILPVTAVHGIIGIQKCADGLMMMASVPSLCAVLARVDLCR
jgi:hypothetical protein